MAIKIYTYSNPYKIYKESYWREIKDCAQFCASQTMVNGVKALYSYEMDKDNRIEDWKVATVEALVTKLFPNWDEATTYMEQYAFIDQCITNKAAEGKLDEKVIRSLKFNKRNILDSVRLLWEMNFDLKLANRDVMTEEQKFIIAFWVYSCKNDVNKIFYLQNSFAENVIKQAVKHALTESGEKKNSQKAKLENWELRSSTIVFHGIHQFSPLILRTIEAIEKYYDVIFLFNYQEKYKNIYQTWIDIYSCFDVPFQPGSSDEYILSKLSGNSYQGNMLGDRIGRLVEGEYVESDSDNLDIYEFNNVTEFANYVADIYEKACKKKGEENKGSALGFMEEQFYAANSEVNDILKVYFPEQFNERHFLAYPIGHFFVAIVNMWDSERGECSIEDMNDVLQCLTSGIIEEKIPGQLASIFIGTREYFSKAKDLKQIKKYLEKLKKRKIDLNSRPISEQTSYLKLEYFQVTEEELDILINALIELEKEAFEFFAYFNDERNDFKDFYKKIKECLEERVVPSEDLDEEFGQVLERIMERLEGIEDGEMSITGSFSCLKESMSVYLKQKKPVQVTDAQSRAQWIVRDFQQIDGDILLSGTKDYARNRGDAVYHFACLSDEDMNVKSEDIFPWPLSQDFFEVAYEPLDWKYQVYVKSKREYKNFKRYALVYGLLFNHAKCKISYVKNVGDKDNEVYYLLKLLNLKSIKNPIIMKSNRQMEQENYSVNGNNKKEYTDLDVYRAKICPYRFYVETILQNGVQYKENFIMLKYFEIVLENRVRMEIAGQVKSEVLLEKVYGAQFDEFFSRINNKQILSKSEEESIKVAVKRYLQKEILKEKKQYPTVTKNDQEYMKRKEEFLYLRLTDDENNNVLKDIFRDLTQTEVNQYFASVNLLSNTNKNVNIWCKYCAIKEICLEPYKEMLE